MHEHIGDAPRLNSASCRAPLCQPPRSYGHSLYGCAIAASPVPQPPHATAARPRATACTIYLATYFNEYTWLLISIMNPADKRCCLELITIYLATYFNENSDNTLQRY